MLESNCFFICFGFFACFFRALAQKLPGELEQKPFGLCPNKQVKMRLLACFRDEKDPILPDESSALSHSFLVQTEPPQPGLLPCAVPSYEAEQ
jgi:hypothetical protein